MTVPIGTLFSLDLAKLCPVEIENHTLPQSSHLDGKRLTLVEDSIKTLDIHEDSTSLNPSSNTSIVGATCISCGIPSFRSPDDQRRHFKTDWHRYNVKRRLAHLDPVSEDAFIALVENVEDQDDLGSLSGSETSSEQSTTNDDDGFDITEGAEHHHYATSGPHMIISDTDSKEAYAVWRCLVAPDRQRGVQDPSFHDRLASLTHLVEHGGRWAIILFRGGHFTASIYDVKPPKTASINTNDRTSSTNTKYSAALADACLTSLAHKSFHKYVVRAKAGGKQSTKDATGKYAKSAGSRLRRHNEAALHRDVEALLKSEWKDQLASCSLIFVAAPGSNGRTLYTGDDPMLNIKSDSRIRRVPFTTRRPTTSEAHRIARVLLTVYDASKTVQDSTDTSSSSHSNKNKSGKEQSLKASIERQKQQERKEKEELQDKVAARLQEEAARAKNAEKRAKQKERLRQQQQQQQQKQIERGQVSESTMPTSPENNDDEDLTMISQAALTAAKKASTKKVVKNTTTSGSVPHPTQASNIRSTVAPARLSSKPLASEDAATRRARMAAAAEARLKALQTASAQQQLW